MIIYWVYGILIFMGVAGITTEPAVTLLSLLGIIWTTALLN